jgi:hypothetical protein
MLKAKECIKCMNIFIPRNGNCDICTKCKKPNKCIHGTTKGRCKIDGCFGNEICQHKQHKQKCSICKPGVKELDKLNSILRKIIFKIATSNNCDYTKMHNKTKSFVIDMFKVADFEQVVKICCEKIKFYEHIYKQKLDVHYYQIDHIKPKSKFNLIDPIEFAKCCHHTNLQIVDKRTNLSKGNKWIY